MSIAVGYYAVQWAHPISVTLPMKWNASAKTPMLAEEPRLVEWVGIHHVLILQINQQPLHQVIYLATSFAICSKKWQGICENGQMNMNNQDIIWSTRGDSQGPSPGPYLCKSLGQGMPLYLILKLWMSPFIWGMVDWYPPRHCRMIDQSEEGCMQTPAGPLCAKQ